MFGSPFDCGRLLTHTPDTISHGVFDISCLSGLARTLLGPVELIDSEITMTIITRRLITASRRLSDGGTLFSAPIPKYVLRISSATCSSFFIALAIGAHYQYHAHRERVAATKAQHCESSREAHIKEIEAEGARLERVAAMGVGTIGQEVFDKKDQKDQVAPATRHRAIEQSVKFVGPGQYQNDP
jgi:hypothetical protein